ncbi:hypothetical protein EJ076_18630 [Mesorhizobium sp. M7D.F.Ca.US.005.01.1.1]|nr:hypothetical protein EJ076_18630 [Mesorhizobium sp. M7D.F.Ca.US.005.01.1.1]
MVSDNGGMSAFPLRRSTELTGLFDYAVPSRCPKSDRAKRYKEEWQPEILDDWPDPIPISERELDLFDVHCSDLLDEIFGARN